MPTVLIVDDSPLIRMMVSAALGQTDLVVCHASGGTEALALCQECTIDAVLLDIELPGENGLDIYNELKSHPHTAAIPVILMSGHAAEELAPSGARVAPDYFLAKPFSPAEVQAVIYQAIGQG